VPPRRHGEQVRVFFAFVLSGTVFLHVKHDLPALLTILGAMTTQEGLQK